MGGHGDTGRHTEGRGCVQGRSGQTSGCGRSQGRYHNWVPCDQFDNLSNEEYQTLICEQVMQGKLQAHHADTDAANPTVPPMGSSISICRIFGAYRLEFSSSIRQLVGLGGLFCQLNVQNKKAWLQQSKPAKMLCTGHREFGTNR